MSMLYTDRADQIRRVVLTGNAVSLAEFAAVCRYDARVELSPQYEQAVRDGQAKLQAILEGGKAVYGVNTGFGDNVRFRIGNEDLSLLQENIVMSHACTVGKTMSRELVRAHLLALLIKLGFGCSGVRLEYAHLIRDYLNLGLTPYVPCQGTIGGLSCPPYIAMTFLGMGRFWDGEQAVKAEEMLLRYGLTPIRPGPKEGFALISDQATCLVPALLALYDLIDAYRHSLICAGLVAEALQCTDRAFDSRLLGVKKHREAEAVAAWMRADLRGSGIMERARDTKVQDATSIRLIPHLFGAVGRQITQTYQVMTEELASVTDNPVFLPNGVALMGSNWDNSYIALYGDSLAIGAAMLSKELETWMERLIDTKLSGLPPFLVREPGLNNGFMIVQYATAGLNGDIANLAIPLSTLHLTVSAGQETPNFKADSVTQKLADSAASLRHITALTLMTALQALDFVEGGPSPVNRALRNLARETVSFLERDDLMYRRIEAMEALMYSGRLLEIAQNHIGPFPL